MKSCAIIGAGPSGLMAAARLVETQKFSVQIFEEGPECGGIWSRPEGSVIYPHLHTNLPLHVMELPEFPFIAADLGREHAAEFSSGMFAHHSAVRRYITRFALEKDLVKHISFNSRVVSARRNVDSRKWTIRVAASDKSDDFDFLIVANGHYNEPLLPSALSSISSSGMMIHSKDYRSPDQLYDVAQSICSSSSSSSSTPKRILVVGGGPSGRDVVGESVRWNLRRSGKQLLDISWCVDTTKNGAEFGGEASLPGVTFHRSRVVNAKLEQQQQQQQGNDRCIKVEFRDGSSAEFDLVVAATGFRFSFSPFLLHDCGSSSSKLIQLAADGRAVQGLWKHLIPVRVHTVAFVGLPIRIIPFPLADAQAVFLARLWTQQISVPTSLEDNITEESLLPRDAKITELHFMGFKMFAYMEFLYRAAGVSVREMRSRLLPPGLIECYKASSQLRKEKALDYQRYEINFDHATKRVVISERRILSKSKL